MKAGIDHLVCAVLSGGERDVISFRDLGFTSHMMMLAAMFAKSQSPWRFNEIRDETELSQTTLSTRLTELVEADRIVRRSYDEISPRVEYEATQKLRDLAPILKDIFA